MNTAPLSSLHFYSIFELRFRIWVLPEHDLLKGVRKKSLTGKSAKAFTTTT